VVLEQALIKRKFNFFKEALLHMLFPSLCFGCEENSVDKEEMICIHCKLTLPFTSFEIIRNNPVEKLFWGRVPVLFSTSTFYYSEKTSIQNIIHHIKYRDQKELGIFMGNMMGDRLRILLQENNTDICMPMPLHPTREKKRGYNQASLLCEGMQQTTGIPYNDLVLERRIATDTQTQKNRTARWNNVKDVFAINLPKRIQNKNIVLVDDVITTGASMEACAHILLENGAKTVAITSLAYTV
jgi:ComF family protein